MLLKSIGMLMLSTLLFTGCLAQKTGATEDAKKITNSEIKESIQNKTAISVDLEGSNTMAYLPPTYDANKKNKFVVFFHGSNGSIDALIKYENENRLLVALLDSGYVVLGRDYSNKTNWGNQQALEESKRVVEYYQSQLSLEDKPIVLAQSMGGITALNAIGKGYLKAKAFVGIYPATNLRNMYEGGLSGDVAKAYSITSDADYGELTKGYDPTNDIDPEVFSKIPSLMFASPEDTVVPKAGNSDEFAKRINGVGGNVEVFEATGEHGDITHFRTDTMIDFLRKLK